MKFTASPVHVALLYLSSITLAVAQFVQPYPASDCVASGGIGFGFASCPNQPGCCSGGSICCAGGCCPITAFCVGMGTAKEGCCPISDKNSCGVALPSASKPTCTGSSGPKPSKLCSTADDTWYCAHGATCGTRWGSCFNIFNGGGDCESAAAQSPAPSGSAGSQSGTGSTRTGSASPGSSSSQAAGAAAASPASGNAPSGMERALGGIMVAAGAFAFL